MLLISNISNDPMQQLTLTGIPGTTINMTLRYMPRIQRWIMGVATIDQSIQGIALTTSPNVLRQYKNRIPFGIACLANASVDPFGINDFAVQSSNLFLLNAADVATIEAQINA